MARRQPFCLMATFAVTELDFISPSEESLSSQITVYQLEQGPERDVNPYSMLPLEKPKLWCSSTCLTLAIHSNHICMLEVRMMWRVMFTHDLLCNPTGRDPELVLPQETHGQEAPLAIQGLEKAFQLCSCGRTFLFHFLKALFICFCFSLILSPWFLTQSSLSKSYSSYSLCYSIRTSFSLQEVVQLVL